LAKEFRLPEESGNPGSRPKVLGEVQELARQHAPSAIAELARLVRTTGLRLRQGVQRNGVGGEDRSGCSAQGHSRTARGRRRDAGEALTDIARTFGVSHTTIGRLTSAAAMG
jgi:hypothetical protein